MAAIRSTMGMVKLRWVPASKSDRRPPVNRMGGKSLHPYSLNESFTLGMLGNVYEGLTKRDKDLKIIPALATSWEIIEPTRWRFHLRRNVKFHNGEDFTADDVVFSAERTRDAGSN